MNKKIIGFIFGVWYLAAYASANVGNINTTAPVNQTNPGLSVEKNLQLKFIIFNYQMTPQQFNNFTTTYHLQQSAVEPAMKNIFYIASLTKGELNALDDKFTKQFTSKMTGSTLCLLKNDSICGGAAFKTATPNTSNNSSKDSSALSDSSILFRTYLEANQNITVKITSGYMSNKNQAGSFLFQSDALLENIANKSYIIVSQVSKKDQLYGQIMLVSFVN